VLGLLPATLLDRSSPEVLVVELEQQRRKSIAE
jgi:hypothetical protein